MILADEAAMMASLETHPGTDPGVIASLLAQIAQLSLDARARYYLGYAHGARHYAPLRRRRTFLSFCFGLGFGFLLTVLCLL